MNALGMSCLCHDADLLWQTPGPQEFGRPGREPWCAERAAVTREDAIGLGRGRTAATRAAATRKQLGGLLQCTTAGKSSWSTQVSSRYRIGAVKFTRTTGYALRVLAFMSRTPREPRSSSDLHRELDSRGTCRPC